MKIWAKLAFSNFHTMGHKAGDDLLMLFAVIITEAFKNKGIVFRIGGDEFAVLIFNAIIEDIKNSEKYMYDCIKENNKNLNRGYKLNVSIGYAISSKNDKEILEVFKEADYNMYREKLNSINSTKNSMIQGLMQLLKARDFITEGHGERMKELSGKMGGSIGLPENVIIDLGLLAQFHDIGKVVFLTEFYLKQVN